jgi:hypothetical protein
MSTMPGERANLQPVPETPTVTREVEAGPPPAPDDDWAYEPRLSVTLNALEMEIVEEDELEGD